MHRKDGQTTDDVYENYDVIKVNIEKKITDSTQGRSSEFTESDCVMIRSSRAAAVCLVLLCVLLLTAVIVLCVMFTQERLQLISKNKNLTSERDQLIFKNENLTNRRDQLKNELLILDGWTYYKSRFYYMPNEMKNWTESRRYCTEREADLIIINNREEQDFVNKMFGGTTAYIGLTDSDVENTWKWVDDTNMTSGFWGSGEPNGGRAENCAVIVDQDQRWPTLFGWHDVLCNRDFKWICEKNISQLILP
ncbi:CD209 antigen-like protein C [Megalobrama amblycephala]|uniref:CD209 antigen-like protein C n=1 Tax=Megalobrama amblycephala TaxID=75352 RepID=UPI0020145F9F|nr:CD209 antigen-like protein C [Megalobrama amblycephala]